MTVTDGYAIQRAWVRANWPTAAASWAARSASPRAMQLSSQIDEPDYAPLMDDMFFAQGGDIPGRALHRAARRGRARLHALAPAAAPASRSSTVLAATEYVVPGAGDHRRAHRAVRPRDQGAAQASPTPSATSPPTPASCWAAGQVKPDAVDLRWVGAMLFKNGVVEETGLAAGVLNHPATGVAWLADKIAPHGEQLNAGDVVLAGSFTRPTPACRGDTLHADYGPLGTVSFRFA